MAKNNIAYRLTDRTGDSDALSRAHFAPQFSRALEDLSFWPVGVLEAQAKNREAYADTVRSKMSPEDAEMMIKFVAQGEVVEITCAPDGQAFGIVERSVGGAVICLETLLENGVVIETTMRPLRAPRPAKPMDRNIRAISLLLALTTAPPLWPRQNAPAAGFFVELVDTRDARVLYERHQARVAEIKARSLSAIPCHDSLDLYKAIRIRTAQVNYHLKQVSDASGILVIVLLLPLIFLAVLWQQETKAIGRSLTTLMVVLIALLVLLVVFSLTRLIAPHIPAALLPVRRLLEIQHEVWG